LPASFRTIAKSGFLARNQQNAPPLRFRENIPIICSIANPAMNVKLRLIANEHKYRLPSNVNYPTILKIHPNDKNKSEI